ncbi:hypothetical protein B0T26DRAFT_622758, partial [Lasiosphaeria miniovina]
MANTYEITILNESGAAQSYLLFAAAPVVTGTNLDVFSSVFIASPTIVTSPSGSSSTTFTITRQFYAICGTSVQNLRFGVKVATSYYDAVTLGSVDINTGKTTRGTTELLTTEPGVHFVNPAPAADAPVGAYTINTDSTFGVPDPNNTFTGLGGLNMNGKVVPMATFLAAPLTTYSIKPVFKYYITAGTYSPGEIINPSSMGITYLVDFTKRVTNSITLVHDSHGGY